MSAAMMLICRFVDIFQANIFWLSHKPLKVGDSLTVHYGTSEANVTVQSIDRVVDTQDLEQTAQAAAVERNGGGNIACPRSGAA